MSAVERVLAEMPGGLTMISSIFLVLSLAFAAWTAYKIIRQYSRPQLVWKKDVTHENVPTPEHYASAEEFLRALGMRLLAVFRVQIRAASRPYDVWLFVASEGDAYTEVVFDFVKPFLLGFSTMFPDQSIICTRYPVGENIVTEQFISRFARHSVGVAWYSHRQQIANWKATKGDPVPIRTAADITAVDEVFVARYQGRDRRRLLRISLSGLAFWLVIAVTNVGVLVSSITRNWNTIPIFVTLAAGAGIIVFVGGLWIGSQAMNSPQAIDTR
jgi:hypothetical protein